jgi:inner membrane protein
MKWINHMAIAGATTAMVSPPLVPIALLGSTAPDWLEWVLEAAGQKVKHRSVTHYVAGWGIGLAFFLGLYDFHHIGAAFFYGGLTHVLADSFTVSGVPFSPHSDRRFHLFGGRLRTGAAGEYMVAWSIVACCFLVKVAISPGNGWYPFFYDWAGHNERGIIDGSDWKANRFRFF